MTNKPGIEKFLAELFRLGIGLWLDAGRLRCSAPENVMTAGIAADIKSRREEIEAFLIAQHNHSQHNPPAEKNPGAGAINPEPGSENPPSNLSGGQPRIGTAESYRHTPPGSPVRLPLSFAQQRLWFIDQMEPQSAAYHITLAVEVEGFLDRRAFATAIDRVVERHEILRTRFVTSDSEPVQQITERQSIEIAFIDTAINVTAADLDPDVKTSAADSVQRIADKESRKPFDLRRDPLLRVTVIRATEDLNVVLITVHHIVADGWSMEIFIRDLAAFYRADLTGAEAKLPPLPVQYGDYAVWQRRWLQSHTLERQIEFWQRRLQHAPATRLSTDFPRPHLRNQTRLGAQIKFALDAEVAEKLRGIGRQQSATLFATLFTVFNVLVYRYTAQADLVIGTPMANRRWPEVENLIGIFVNPLAIRTRLAPRKSFAANLEIVQRELWQAFQHQDLPFEKLVEVLQPERDPALHPVFQIKFQMDHARGESVELPGLKLRPLPGSARIAKLDLSLNLVETPAGVSGRFEYNTDLFAAPTIERMAQHFLCLAQAIARRPDTPVADLELLSAAERLQRLRAWNNSARPYATGTCFHHLFEAQAARRPDAVALIYDDGETPRRTLSFDQLNRKANQLAHYLIEKGIGPEVVAGICVRRSPEMVIALLAVMKAGGAWLPLDPTYPGERIHYMLADARVPVLLSETAIDLPVPASQSEGSIEVERIDLNTQWPDGAPDHNPGRRARPDNLAYLIYTSGSTGRPKGVLIAHGGLVNLTEDKIRVCDVRENDCVLQFFSFSFDASIPELVMSLAAGARLLLTSARLVLPGPDLRQLIERNRVTHITMTPSALLNLPAADYPDLRMVLVGGEAPSPELIAQWCPGRRFINAYGPTETTVNASMVACGNGHPLEPTLAPAANKQLLILDSDLQLLPAGVPGELHIGGIGLARGYRNRPDLTAERFIPNPFATADDGPAAQVLYKSGDLACYLPDGRIRVLGRLDNQIKIRGYRIELDEIERALLAHPHVKTGVVVVREDGAGGKRLVACAVPTAGAEAIDIKSFLRERLPPFMVPSACIWLDELPLTPNGKIDTRALPAPGETAAGAARIPPRTATEAALAAIFKNLLQVDEVGAEDDFFDLGGHSLLATRLVAECLNAFNVEIKLVDLFSGPTVAALAGRIDRLGQGQRRQAATPEREALRGDLTLAEDIRPARPPLSGDPQHILLTGASGFIGAYLLRELLAQTAAEIHCLVRVEPGQGESAGRRKLEQALAAYGIRADMHRIHPVIGDLAAPGFGLPAAQYERLAALIDSIWHNGALVHHLLPYKQLRSANIGGTATALRLACEGKTKSLHYTSSLSVLPARPLAGRERILETDPLHLYPVPASDYNRSKWVAEQLVSEAGRRGLPITIHRPGPVSGDSHSGAFNPSDTLCQLVRGYIHTGMAPEGESPLPLLPVDYLARSMVYLSRRGDAVGKTFHFLHSTPVSSARLFDACRAQGFAIERVPRQAWHAQLMAIAGGDGNHPLYPLIPLLTRSQGAKQRPAAAEAIEAIYAGRLFDTTQARAMLAGAPFREPPLDENLFRVYLRALAGAGDNHLRAAATGGRGDHKR